jgi:DNA (cytosine-5)-methyltransferase 1
LKYIELFAGCGGLSLGLESIGSQLILANELSPMAAETFSYNFYNEDLAQKAKEESEPDRTYWLTSNFTEKQLNQRLREDPRTYPDLIGEDYISDLKTKSFKLGSMVVGSIVTLNDYLEQNADFLEQLRLGFGEGEIDVVSGGPPCQSFSLAGLRQRSNDRNILPWEFAKFVGKVKPKFAVLENVTGILRAFSEGDKKYYAWFEVAKAFAEVGYVPLCLHVNAKYAGVAQNRPRFIMIAVRHDLMGKLKLELTELECSLFESAEFIFRQVQSGNDCDVSQLKHFDAEKQNDLSLFQHTFLKDFVAYADDQHTVYHAIDGLRDLGEESEYVRLINKTFELSSQNNGFKKEPDNHELRLNSPRVKQRFRVYQIIKRTSKETAKEVKQILKSANETLSDSAYEELAAYLFSDGNGGLIEFSNKNGLESLLKSLATKKQTQRALVADKPAPAALSIPDDACHYDESELRTLTVREMARIQSFPDSFVFRSKVTTGGKMRRFEVPQYTQVGNAVPPLLGLAIGKVLNNLIKKLGSS